MQEYGTCKWFSPKLGYGYIWTDDGRSFFVHWRCLNMDGFKKLEEGQRVAFDAGANDKGPLALNVSVVVESEAAE